MKSTAKILPAAMLLAATTLSAADATDNIMKRLDERFPGHDVKEVVKAPLPGFYEAVLGGEVVYVSEDANYLLHGSLYDLREGLVNVTEARQNTARRDAMAALSEDEMIIFGPEKADHTITVFTDIDCGYCRKLHGEMDRYNDAGIRIRYLFYPRSGPNTPSFDKAVSVWCADDRQEAMTAAKRGDDVEARTCDNPVMKDYELGQQMGITGTPAMVLNDGQLVPGYVPADRLKAMLDAHKATSAGG
jgi:thiol:disulfide interchange protein DsbC